MPTSRELFKALFAGNAARPPFIPLVASAGARLMQVPLRDVYSDAGVMAKTLRDCQSLFGYDGILVFPDATLEAEALGCKLDWIEGQPPTIASTLTSFADLNTFGGGRSLTQGRLPTVIAAATQLVESASSRCAILGSITGPIAIAQTALPSEDLNPIVVEKISEECHALARAFFERRVDGIIVRESSLACVPTTVHDALVKTFRTLKNLAQFYDVPLLLAIDDSSELVDALPVDAVSNGGWEVGNSGTTPWGAAISASDWDNDLEDQVRSLMEKAGGGTYLTTKGEVPFATPADRLHELMDELEA